MKYDNSVILEMHKKNDLDCIFFWGHTNAKSSVNQTCFSQWYESAFVVDGVQYKTAEHYMMAEKAKLFNDLDQYKLILASDTPKDAKVLGRGIKNFDFDKWNEVKFDIVVNGNIHKFSQNSDLKTYLLSTGSKILVESSPYDKIWGIGMTKDVDGVDNPNNWQGENLLGYALMCTRDRLNQ